MLVPKAFKNITIKCMNKIEKPSKKRQNPVEETISDFIKAAFSFYIQFRITYLQIYTGMSHNIFISTPYSVDTIGK